MSSSSLNKWPMPQTQSFAFWWEAPGQWVEPPNIRRGGWSGVLRCRWQNRAVYLKRQHQHFCREWLHPLGWPTLCREYRNLLTLQKLGIHCPAPVYFAREGAAAVLVVEALDGFVALDQLHLDAGPQREQLALNLGRCLGHMHKHHLQHGCLYAKHIFVRQSADAWQIALIDLEKMRWRPAAKKSAQHDLDQLQRHQSLLDAGDWEKMLQAHHQSFTA